MGRNKERDARSRNDTNKCIHRIFQRTTMSPRSIYMTRNGSMGRLFPSTKNSNTSRLERYYGNNTTRMGMTQRDFYAMMRIIAMSLDSDYGRYKWGRSINMANHKKRICDRYQLDHR